jgi:hypothetical protein
MVPLNNGRRILVEKQRMEVRCLESGFGIESGKK